MCKTCPISGAAPLSPVRTPYSALRAATAPARRACSLYMGRLFCRFPPRFRDCHPRPRFFMRETHTDHVSAVRTLLDPTTGSSTLVPECRAAPCNRGTAVDLLSKVRDHYAPRGASPQVPNKCLTRAKCSVTFRDMHNHNDTPALTIYYAQDGLPTHYEYNGKTGTIRFNHPARPRYREINEASVARFKKIIGKGNYVYVPTAAANAYHDIEEALEALERLEVA